MRSVYGRGREEPRLAKRGDQRSGVVGVVKTLVQRELDKPDSLSNSSPDAGDQAVAHTLAVFGVASQTLL
jgi:hypothetical protein